MRQESDRPTNGSAGFGESMLEPSKVPDAHIHKKGTSLVCAESVMQKKIAVLAPCAGLSG